MALINILSNAIQYAKSIVEISVSLQKLETKKIAASICIEDDGIGISKDDHAHVTKPFWRGRNDSGIKGHGMGLAIVARIAQWLKIGLTIERSESLGGASIILLIHIH